MAEALEVTATWCGGYATDVRARGHEIRVDEPGYAGGQDSGAMPTELFCAALASCFCLAMGHVAMKRALDLPGLRVTVRARRAGRELRYDRVEVEAAAATEAGTLARVVERARPFCWISNMLEAGVEVRYVSTTLNGHLRK